MPVPPELLNAVYGRLADAIVGRVLPSVNEQSRRLFAELAEFRDDVTARLDDQNLVPVRSGLLFLRDGDLEHARLAFTDAVSTDRWSPVARLLYGLALAKSGRTERAAEELVEAWRLNPFVLDDLVNFGGPPAGKDGALPSERWSVQLGRGRSPSLRGRMTNALLSDTRIRAVAVGHDPVKGSARMIVEWERSTKAEGRAPLGKRGRLDEWSEPARVSVLTGLDLAAPAQAVGASSWTMPLPPESELVFVTPSIVVVRSLDGDERFELLDIASGKTRRARLPAEYFEAMFCPSRASLETMPAFQRAHRRLAPDLGPVRRALDDPRAELPAGLERRDSARAKRPAIQESAEVRSPWDDDGFRARVINVYWWALRARTSAPRLRCRAVVGREA